MGELILTDEQQAAVAWVVEQLTSGTALVAIRGLAGTGKTTLIGHLRQALAAVDIPVSIGSPTHRAAMILKRKGLHDATTLHAHALTPYFTLEYAEAMSYLGEAVPCREDVWQVPPSPPWLIQERLRDDSLTDLKRANRLYGAKKALESLGIQGRDHFDGFGPKLGMGCLVIDEASMLGREQLALCHKAFPLLCLIGDPGQLPPVNDVRVLDEVPGFDLTQIHRQAEGSPIIQLAYAARRGEPVWNQFTPQAGAVERWRDAPAAQFLQVPLIVWRNDTRVSCTKAIRAALYGAAEADLAVGEPLVCRASSAADRAEGFYNNALFRVVAVSPADWLESRQVTVMPEGSDDEHDARDVLVHMEELHGDRIDPRAVVFRFGYCLTAHTAQGGEWPTVAISQPDLLAFAGFARRKPEHAAELQQWLYTALTRAKQCVGFLTQHLFTQATQVSVGPIPWPSPHEESPTMDITSPVPTAPSSGKAPTFMAAPDPSTVPESPGAFPPLTDDIPAVQVPASVMASIVTELSPLPLSQETLVDATTRLLEGKITDLLAATGTATMKALERVYDHMAACLDKIAVANDHAQYQLANALDRLSAAGVKVHGPPYTATVQARTPQGFPVTLTLHKGSAEDLVQALEGLSTWLQTQSYTAPSAQPFEVDANGNPLPF